MYEQEPKQGEPDLNARPDEIYIATMAFDDPTAYPPEEHVRRIPFIALDQLCDKSQDLTPTTYQQHDTTQDLTPNTV